MAEQEWKCPNPGCGKLNFARRNECHRCKTAIPRDISTTRGPAGLFKPGDWTCDCCGNVNWEKRNTCNMCHTAKPKIGEPNEVRNGIGGGFNERQERVATAKAEIDEDGYDDYGQKKKKVKANRNEREAAALARLKGNYGSLIRDSTEAVENKRILTSFQYKPQESTTSVTSPPGFCSKNENATTRKNDTHRSTTEYHRAPTSTDIRHHRSNYSNHRRHRSRSRNSRSPSPQKKRRSRSPNRSRGEGHRSKRRGR